MESQPQGRKGRSEAPSSSNAEIDALNLARDTAAVKQAGGVFASARSILNAIKVGIVIIHAGRSLDDEHTI